MPPAHHCPRPRLPTRCATSLSMGLAFFGAPVWAQTAPPGEPLPDAAVAMASAPAAWASAGGLGVFHYTEPGVMRLTGPEASWQLRHHPTPPGWPDSVQLDLGVASLAYSSKGTGTLHAVPALSGRGTALWRLQANEDAIWRAGLQLDMVWTDLRGTSSTGHRGYRRLGSKAWAVLQREDASGARTEIGALLQGRQDSWLTDAGQPRDITNTQRRGVYLAYQHHAMGALSLRPWLRYSQIGNSTYDGPYLEPRNRTVQVGALIDW